MTRTRATPPPTSPAASRAREVRRSGAWSVLPATALVAAVVGVGVVAAAAESLGLLPLVGRPGLSAQGWRAGAGSEAFADGLRVTVAVAGASTALALAGGMLTALLVLRSARGARLLAAVAAAGVPIPHLVGATSVGLLLADSGLVARLVGAEPGTFPTLVGGPWWVAVVAEYAWKETLFVAVVVLGAVGAGERELDEAAAVLGARALQRARRVSLPLAAPALVASGAITFAYVVGSYEVPWLLGRAYPEPLPVLAFRLYSATDLATRPAATAVALATAGVAAGALAAGAMALRRLRSAP